MASPTQYITLILSFLLLALPAAVQADSTSNDSPARYYELTPGGIAPVDEEAGIIRFSEYPMSGESAEPEQSPEDISSHELLKAYGETTLPDPQGADSRAAAAQAPAQPGVRHFGEMTVDQLSSEIIKPLTVVNQDLKDPVDKNIHLFSVRLKDRFGTWLSRSGKYVGMMTDILREEGLPEELVYLALIESGFNPKAYSWAKASGPWQFITGTGKKYGLKIDYWVDERRDPVKSTKAAAAYLKDLYNMFGTWALAMASYNAGEGRVARAVQSHGTLDFWEIRKTRSISSETREYVPRFLAAKLIAQNPEMYGFDGVEYEPPLEFDEVEVNSPTDLKVAAKCAGVSVDEIKELNPELRRWCTPPDCDSYTLRVPPGTKDAFLASYKVLPKSDKAGWDEYIVRRGDTLGRIASRYNVPVSLLTSTNKIRRASLISVGQRLMIPVSGASPAVYTRADHDDGVPATYRVRRGDTLSVIARKLGTSVSRLASANGISARSKIYPGQVLKTTGGSPSARNSRYSGGGTTYRVNRGDTLWRISKKFGVSVADIMRANSLSRRSVLKPGQKLVIPAAAEADAA